MSKTITTEDGYLIEETSYRSWKVTSPKGSVYYVYAHPVTNFLECSCPYATWMKRHRNCRHMKMIKEHFNYV